MVHGLYDAGSFAIVVQQTGRINCSRWTMNSTMDIACNLSTAVWRNLKNLAYTVDIELVQSYKIEGKILK